MTVPRLVGAFAAGALGWIALIAAAVAIARALS